MNDTLPAMPNALVVRAHPDDESFGLGAILSVFADTGSRVSVLCFTHGEASTLHGVSGELAAIRAEELAAAGAILDVTDVELLDYPDGHLNAQPLDQLADHALATSTAAATVRTRSVSSQSISTTSPSGLNSTSKARRVQRRTSPGGPGGRRS